MDRHRTVAELIEAVVERRTRWLRHYSGQVCDNDDPSGKGRVKAMVLELGWDSADRAAWCWPRQGHGMSVPSVGQWVEVYFMCGDPNRAVYLPLAAEFAGQTPKAFDGKPGTRVILQDPDTGDAIIYDAASGEFRIRGLGKHLVTWEDLNSALQNHVHAPGTFVTTCPAGAGTVSGGLSGAPSGLNLTAAKTAHLKTDG